MYKWKKVIVCVKGKELCCISEENGMLCVRGKGLCCMVGKWFWYASKEKGYIVCSREMVMVCMKGKGLCCMSEEKGYVTSFVV